jgi:hypothetical protein
METQTPGRTFEDVEDWLVYLRDVIARPDTHPELGASPTRWLSTLEAAVRGGPRAGRLSDAALALLEDGTEAERDAALELTLHVAPDAVPRLRALLERPGLLPDVRVRCASELLAASREDPVGLAVLREALAGPGVRRRALLAAARHLPEWPASFVPLAEPDEALLLALWQETPATRRRLFVDAVAARRLRSPLRADRRRRRATTPRRS